MIVQDEAIMELTKEQKENRILLNRIRCPDGTILTSYSRHDYVTHLDENGHTYMVDGGVDYLRRTIIEEAPYEELSVYWCEDHAENRKYVTWGTYGKNGDQPLKYVKLKDMSTDHINAVLETCRNISSLRRELFEAELNYRNEHGIV